VALAFGLILAQLAVAVERHVTAQRAAVTAPAAPPATLATTR
jgi:hypothetical protein